MPVNEIWRKHGISSATYYKWKAKYGGLDMAELKRVKELEAENAKLKRMYADLAVENHAIKAVLNDDVTYLSHISGRWPRSGSMVAARQSMIQTTARPPWQRILRKD
jgi:putative transposase